MQLDAQLPAMGRTGSLAERLGLGRYHFWMSTFTVVHHTASHIPFKAADQWNAAKAQLSGTVHCDYPRW